MEPPPDEPDEPDAPPAPTAGRPEDEASERHRIAELKEKGEELRARADETWKRVEASRSTSAGIDTAFQVYERDRDRLGPLLSAAIAFRLFLVFVPYVAFVVILAALFGVDREDLTTAGIGGLTAQSVTDVST